MVEDCGVVGEKFSGLSEVTSGQLELASFEKGDHAPVSLRNTELVGRYALNFVWSDGHQTGIFSFDYLRKLAGLDGP